MYTILMTQDKRLVQSFTRTVYQHESGVDAFKFIIPCIYRNFDLRAFDGTVEYTTPSGKVLSEKLDIAKDIYKQNWLCGHLTIDSKFTDNIGPITISLIFKDQDKRTLRSDSTTVFINAVNKDEPISPPSDDEDFQGFEVVQF
jgi:hypothetical protein